LLPRLPLSPPVDVPSTPDCPKAEIGFTLGRLQAGERVIPAQAQWRSGRQAVVSQRSVRRGRKASGRAYGRPCQASSVGQETGNRNDWLIGVGTAALLAAVGVLVLTWSWPFNAIHPFAGVGEIDCDDYHFDGDTWADQGTADEEARALVRCDTLVGLSKIEVESLLGRAGITTHHGTVLSYPAGEVNDSLGPGDGREALWIRFDDGVVSAAEVPQVSD